MHILEFCSNRRVILASVFSFLMLSEMAMVTSRPGSVTTGRWQASISDSEFLKAITSDSRRPDRYEYLYCALACAMEA